MWNYSSLEIIHLSQNQTYGQLWGANTYACIQTHTHTILLDQTSGFNMWNRSLKL